MVHFMIIFLDLALALVLGLSLGMASAWGIRATVRATRRLRLSRGLRERKGRIGFGWHLQQVLLIFTRGERDDGFKGVQRGLYGLWLMDIRSFFIAGSNRGLAFASIYDLLFHDDNHDVTETEIGVRISDGERGGKGYHLSIYL